MKYIKFYNGNKDKIFSYFYYNLNQNLELSEDLTSETFLKWFEKFETYNEEYQFSTWIFTIARNTLIDFFRKNKIEITIDETTEITYSEFTQYEQDFAKKIDTDEKMKQVYRVMDQLSEDQREVIVMKYLSEFSTKEISHITGRWEASIRKVISRWLKRLESLLLPL